ncbi:hypothetical protein [Streptomyces sp. NPDC003832]
MPSLSTLTDNFNDNVIGPNWGNSYGGVTESGGQAHVPCATGYAGYQTAYSWTLAGATFYVAVTAVPAASTATEAYTSVFVNAPDIATSGTRIGFVINTVTGQLRCKSDTGYYDAGAVDLTYNATTHKFVRLREDGTNVYWDTSPDGTTWTNRRTLATPAWVTASVDTCALDLSAHRDVGVADEATYDLFNTLSDGAVYTGAAAGSAESAATAAGTLAATGAGAGSAETGASSLGIAVIHGAGTGSAQSDGSATGEGDTLPEVAGLTAGDWNLKVEQGATFVQTFTALDDGFSWDGWTARAQIRSAPADSGDLLLNLTPYLTVDGPSVQIAVPAAQTQALTRNGVWDLEMVSGSTVVRWIQGRVLVSLEVTR